LKDDRVYLTHILECIQRVREYTHDDYDTFKGSTLVQDATIRNLQIMSESTQRISQTIKDSNSDIDWRRIAGLRNVLTHDYLSIDLEVVWNIVVQYLPVFQNQIQNILNGLEDAASDSEE